jgi:hypothetical protein
MCLFSYGVVSGRCRRMPLSAAVAVAAAFLVEIFV